MTMTRILAGYDTSRRIRSFCDETSKPNGLAFVEITPRQHAMLLEGAAAGKTVAVTEDGHPILLEPEKQTRAQLADAKRAARDAALVATDWLTSRHQDEKALGDGTTLMPDEYAQLLRYRQALRNLGDATGWPNVDLPTPPACVAAST
ncbi:phage tail protein [Burkholderia thailandensis]|nr:phage tail protein [Burkholderia thailandensis]MDD1485141.1 phage tail protein [Burkholderia thailandensis]MDD1491850.1 phage tail protein [Burkholderia thailandensis]